MSTLKGGQFDLDRRVLEHCTECCEVLGVTFYDVLAHRRDSSLVRQVRFALGWMLRARFRMSYPHIGRILDRDHTTIMQGSKKFSRAIAGRERWAHELNERLKPVGRPSLEIGVSLDELRRALAAVPEREAA